MSKENLESALIEEEEEEGEGEEGDHKEWITDIIELSYFINSYI